MFPSFRFIPKLHGCGQQHSPVLQLGRGFRTNRQCRNLKLDEAKAVAEPVLGVPYNR